MFGFESVGAFVFALLMMAGAIGGIVGSVVSVNESEVTLKVDESANVKITFLRSAIQRVRRQVAEVEACEQRREGIEVRRHQKTHPYVWRAPPRGPGCTSPLPERP